MSTAEIHVVGMGYDADSLSVAGYRALKRAKLIMHTSEFDAAMLSDISPDADIRRIEVQPRFLADRSDFYENALDELYPLAKASGCLGVPVLGSPFLFEGISAYLRRNAPSDVRIQTYAAPSVIDGLLGLFPSLPLGHGFQVLDSSSVLFSASLDPRVDLVLLQFGRAGSRRHTLGYTPNLNWYRHVFSYIATGYPPSSTVSLVTLGPGGGAVGARLDAVESIYPHLNQATTIVVASPFKPRPDTEADVLSRLVSPLEVALRQDQSHG